MRVLVLFALLAFAYGEYTRYDGYEVFRVTPRDKDSFDALVKLYDEQSAIYDFWTEPRGLNNPIDIMVPPTYVGFFNDMLNVYRMDYELRIPDVQKVVEASRRDQARADSRLTWTQYYDYPAIEQFLVEIARNHSDLATLSSIGQTYEGRTMHLLKISKGGTGKKAIVVDGGIHAREWISPAFVTWLINELVVNYAAHPQYVDNVDWYIMPVINPDGYQFSHTNTRLWRKNRKVIQNCVGVDMNRNFGFHWNEGGSSNRPCDDTYHGASAFSEIESQNVRDAILRIGSSATVYLTFHSYGQYFLYPWGYTTALPDDVAELDALAQSAVRNLTAVSGTQYTIGSSTNTLYIASGGSDDWAKGGANIKYSYTVEMRDEGLFGFQLPAGQILPNNREVWEAVKVVAQSQF